MKNISELHGNATYAKCLDCGARHELSELRTIFLSTNEPPVCDICGGIVKNSYHFFWSSNARRRNADFTEEGY